MKIRINLLPESKKALMAKKKRYRNLIKQEILFVFPLLVFISMLAGINLILEVERKGIDISQGISDSQTVYKDLKSYEDEAKSLNRKVSEIKKFNDAHLRWVPVLDKLIGLVPTGIHLSDLSTAEYRILLVGKADHRDMLIGFQEAIEREECFEDVVLPSSSLVIKEDVVFQMDFNVKKECLVKK